MRRGILLGFAAACLLAGAIAVMSSRFGETIDNLRWTLDPTRTEVTLDDVEREVVLRYRVPDMSASTLEREIASKAITLFDVRTVDEFKMGHLPGSIRIDPHMTAEAFLAEHGALLKGKPAIFYCAVGVRSSRIMTRFLQDIAPAATAGVYNLRGGLFRWVGEGRKLVSHQGSGNLHPFDDAWGQLLQRSTAPR